MRIFNFSYSTPLFYISEDGVIVNNGEVFEASTFNQIILLQSDIFGPYGSIPIAIHTNLSFSSSDGDHTYGYSFGCETLNNLDFEYTPTKTLNSLNNISILPANPYSSGTLISEPFQPAELLLEDGEAAGVGSLVKLFTISFIVELHYEN